jgi:predicted Zn-dependent protease
MLKGDRPAVLERLGDAYADLGNAAVAADVYMKLSELEPRRVSPLVKAARAFLSSGDPEAAARVCRRGLAANPENQVLLALLEQSKAGINPTQASLGPP